MKKKSQLECLSKTSWSHLHLIGNWGGQQGAPAGGRRDLERQEELRVRVHLSLEWRLKCDLARISTNQWSAKVTDEAFYPHLELLWTQMLLLSVSAAGSHSHIDMLDSSNSWPWAKRRHMLHGRNFIMWLNTPSHMIDHRPSRLPSPCHYSACPCPKTRGV